MAPSSTYSVSLRRTALRALLTSHNALRPRRLIDDPDLFGLVAVLRRFDLFRPRSLVLDPDLIGDGLVLGVVMDGLGVRLGGMRDGLMDGTE